MRCFAWSLRTWVLMGLAGGLIVPSSPAQEQKAAQAMERVVLAEGDAYRLVTFAGSGGLEVETRDREGQWAPLTRKDGEVGWYGYNRTGAGERRSSDVAPTVSQEERQGVVVKTVSCEIEPGVVHRAEYVAQPRFCVVASELQAAQPPEEAGIIRIAPRFDVDLRRLFCYGLRDSRGILHTGTVAALDARPAYVGTGGWGGPGCVVAGLDASRSYLAFFNPIAGPLVAFVFPHPKVLWPGGRHFLQLWEGSSNYLYAGIYDGGHFNQPAAFAVYARDDGDLAGFEADLPAVQARVEELAAGGALRLPPLAQATQVRERLAAVRASLAAAGGAGEGGWTASWKRRYAAAAAGQAIEAGNLAAAQALLDWGG